MQQVDLVYTIFYKDEPLHYEADNEDSDEEYTVEEFENNKENIRCATPESFLVYNCGDCHKDFRYKHELKMHTRQHTRFYILPFTKLSTNRNLFLPKMRKKLKRERVDNSDSDEPIPTKRSYKSYLMIKSKKMNSNTENSVQHFKPEPPELNNECSDEAKIIQQDENRFENQRVYESLNIEPFAQNKSEKRMGVENIDSEIKQLSPTDLDNHFQIKMRYRCRICHRKYLTRGELIQHGKIHDHLRNKKCKICGKAFIKDDCLRNHENRHKKLGFFYRSVHLKSISGEDNINDEVNKSAREQGEKNNDKGELNTFSEIGKQEGPENTPQNVLGSEQVDNIGFSTGHKKGRVSKMPYACRVCLKSFAFRGDLVMHGKVHDNLRIHECHICGKAFVMKDSLKNHVNRHLFRGEYKDDPCNSSESSNSHGSYQRRQKTKKAPVKTHKCEICGKMISNRCNLRKHISRIHSGDYPFDCDYCRACFRSENDLEIHLSVHQKKRPYKCDECGRLFCTNSELRVHYRQHDGDRPYPCLMCHKRFVTNMDLIKHTRLHNGLKPFKCVACDKSFRTNTGLDAHIQECLGS